ncbi:T9SS type B sorting domain-containing protein [Acidiluteibacter ferrifornacis]|uniref:T9SS type B sorting domain-containing protein n=1 Tax=Acidiluteibacter ferrifornacis TaxID=2692424 RepID=A0A6N9NJD9_9FLAO|nr:gliding motility-associated C-terminal domain-containing protein [Acidiluteibacter ferrifornacis]NBG65969.1 T9SS type B sorting domain-containing protein [Acidiluteibacter ferrifornacis]
MKLSLTLIILFWAVQCTAQNLIPNPSFEDTSKTGWSYYLPDQWRLAGGVNRQPEYYNEYHDKYWTVPQSAFGYQYAQEGNKYLGITMYFLYHSWKPLRDYIQTDLNQSLMADSIYCFRIHVNLPDSFSHASRNQLGIYLSNNRVSSNSSYNLPYTPQIVVSPSNYITETKNWAVYNHTYKAVGGEKVLTMGNFNDTTGIDTLYMGYNRDNYQFFGTYYFIDNLYLGSCATLPLSYDGSIGVQLDSALCYTSPVDATLHYTNTGEEWLDFTRDTLHITTTVKRNGFVVQTIQQEVNSNSYNPIPTEALFGGNTAKIPLQGLDFTTLGANYELSVTATFNRDEVSANNQWDTAFVPNHQMDDVTISADTICKGESIQLVRNNSNGNAQWQYSTDAVVWSNLIAGDTANHIPTASPMYYRLSVCNTLFSDPFKILQHQPSVLKDSTVNYCQNITETIVPQFSASISTINWYNTPSASTPFYQGYFYRFKVNNNQTFYLETEIDGCKAEERSKIEVIADPCALIIPSFFTPNGDGDNDTWIIGNTKGLPIDITIFNTWGMEVAQWKNSPSWEGNNAAAGVYFYLIKHDGETYKGKLSVWK